MISYSAYRLIHLLGIFLLFLGLGGLTIRALAGADDRRTRRLAAITHGVGLVLILVGGFGLLARLGVGHGSGWPHWVYGKLIIWLLMGAAIVVIRKLGGKSLILWLILPLLGLLAAYMAIYKPGSGEQTSRRPAVEETVVMAAEAEAYGQIATALTSSSVRG